MSELIKKLIVPVSVILALIGAILVWARGSEHEQLLGKANQLSALINQMQLRQQVSQRLAQDLITYYQQSKDENALRILVASGLVQQQPAPQGTAAQQPSKPATTPATPAPRSR